MCVRSFISLEVLVSEKEAKLTDLTLLPPTTEMILGESDPYVNPSNAE